MDTQQATKDVKEKMDQLLDKVDAVIDQQKELVKKQEVILEQVVVEEKEEEAVVEEVEIEKVSEIQKSLIERARHHKLLFPLIITAGVVLVWRGLSGIFDATPVISYSFISLALGVIILWVFNRMNLF